MHAANHRIAILTQLYVEWLWGQAELIEDVGVEEFQKISFVEFQKSTKYYKLICKWSKMNCFPAEII